MSAERQQQIGAQEPPSEHDQLAHLVEVEIPRIEAERDALAARLAGLQDTLAEYEAALQRIAEQQPKTLGWIRAHEIVFDEAPGTDPSNWQHVAFSIYSDLCEADSIARAALALNTDGEATERLPCGHDFTAVVSGDEGTSYCGACASGSGNA